MKDPQPTRATTPALDTLLGSLEIRVRRGIWLHGLGTLAAALAAWALFAFLADWALRVPGPVRAFHTLALAGLVVWVVWREIARPLSRLPDRSGLALLIERQHPELHELFVSAVQLSAAVEAESPESKRGTPDSSSLLVKSVIQEAESRARTLDPGDALDPSGPSRRLMLGVGGLSGVLVLALVFPLHAGTFLARTLGAGPNWPQRTHLAVEIPDLGEGTEVERTRDLVRVRVARGTDVPVVVRAEGVVPDEVTLHFDGGRDLVLNPTGAGLFRTLLRSLQDDVRFHVTGGDDTGGLPVIEVEVLQPPDIEGLAIAVTPPEYTGLPAQLTFEGDVEVLVGSHVIVSTLPTPPQARGVARLLPQDTTVELTPRPFPSDPAKADDPVAPREGLGFEFWADRSLGFRIELSDEKGLSNPDPGLFRVQVIEDSAPEIQVLEPARGEIEVVLGGTLPLRARIADDFGLLGASWTVIGGGATGSSEQAGGRESSFTLRPLAPEQSGAGRASDLRARQAALASVRLEVNSLAGPGAQVAADQRYEILLQARDNRAPEANQGRSFPIRVRVVTPEELLRRMQDRLGQARLSALRLAELQGEKRSRVEELFGALTASDASAAEGVDARAVANAIAGQRRVIADARSVAQELASIAADVLFARIEEKAEGLLEAYDARVSLSADARFRPEIWQDLAASIEKGRIGDAGFAGKLVTLVDLALAISEQSAPAAAGHLAEAERASDPEGGATQIALALEEQDLTLRRIDELVDELAQWNNFQDVLQLTRDILNRQRTLRERTERFAKKRDR